MNLYHLFIYVNTEAAMKKTIKEKKKKRKEKQLAETLPCMQISLPQIPPFITFHHQGYHLKYNIPYCIPQDRLRERE